VKKGKNGVFLGGESVFLGGFQKVHAENRGVTT